MDTEKEVNAYPLRYIEHGSKGSPQPIPQGRFSTAPEALPPSGLEVSPTHKQTIFPDWSEAPEYMQPSDLEVLEQQKAVASITSKPLPPDPYHKGVDQPPTKRRSSRKAIAIIIVVAVLAIVAIVTGVVVGTRDNKAGDSKGKDQTKDESDTPTSNPSTSGPMIDVPSEEDVKIGSSFTSSFTFYGSADGIDGVNCKKAENACGIVAKSGFAAGVSQNLYGNGITCGTCWKLHGEVDGGLKVLNRTIVVKVNEVCMAEGYPICAQRNLTSVNQFNTQVNFNLCIDTGASDALFGFNNGVDFATGRVTRVDCKEWEGESESLW